MSDSVTLNSPFAPTTTPTIERANRLMAVRAHPGFQEIIRLSQELVNDAVKICMHYPGWDPQQITVLKVRMQVAQEHHEAILAKINEAIQRGVAEAREQATVMPEKSAEEAVDQGDLVRQRVLENFSEMDSRVPGSY